MRDSIFFSIGKSTRAIVKMLGVLFYHVVLLAGCFSSWISLTGPRVLIPVCLYKCSPVIIAQKLKKKKSTSAIQRTKAISRTTILSRKITIKSSLRLRNWTHNDKTNEPRMQEVLEPPQDETDDTYFYNHPAIPPIKDVKETTSSGTTHFLDGKDQKDKALKNDRIDSAPLGVDDNDAERIPAIEKEPEPTDCNYCAEVEKEKQKKELVNKVNSANSDELILDILNAEINSSKDNKTIISEYFIFEVFVIHDDNERKTDIMWEFKEDGTNNVIELKLNKKIANYIQQKMKSVKMSIVKYKDKSSRQESQSQIHGPYVIVYTNNTEDEYSIDTGTPVFEFQMNKTGLISPQSSWTCVFWNETSKRWSKDGVNTKISEEHVTCVADHLSSFSVLLDPFPDDENNPEDFQEILIIISIMGSLISMPCLAMTAVIYYKNRARRKKISSKILIHCSAALLMMHISFHMFLLFKHKMSCYAINFLTHYFVSSSLLWTAADGINMWRKLFVDIFDKKRAVFYRWSNIVSYGLPLLTTTIGVSVTEYPRNEVCRIHFRDNYNIFLYCLPCLMVVLWNIFFFSVMFTNVICKNKIKRLSGRKVNYVLSLVQVFGMFWSLAFPFLWFQPTRFLGQILFAVTVSSQGAVIFLVRCLNEKDIKQEIKEWTISRRVFKHVLPISDSAYSSGGIKTTDIATLDSCSGGQSTVTYHKNHKMSLYNSNLTIYH